jgi:hypothetical protein
VPPNWSFGRADAVDPVRPECQTRTAGQYLSKVSSYNDLEPALLGRVEELIDFVTSPDGR